MSRAVVLLSGGIDSTTVLSMVVPDLGAENVYTLSFNYGQAHRAELYSAGKVAKYYQVKEHHVLRLPAALLRWDLSALTGGAKLPHQKYGALDLTEAGFSPTYVPFRNGTLISLATAFALRRSCSRLYVGTHQSDEDSGVYPDCTADFIVAMGYAVWLGSANHVLLLNPLQSLTKTQIITLGLTRNAPYHLTRSCYSTGPLACGRCPTCQERLAAFEANNIDDPGRYQK